MTRDLMFKGANRAAFDTWAAEQGWPAEGVEIDPIGTIDGAGYHANVRVSRRIEEREAPILEMQRGKTPSPVKGAPIALTKAGDVSIVTPLSPRRVWM